MQLDDFDYSLPQHLIAQHPSARRRDARLLVLDRSSAPARPMGIADLPGLLCAGDVLVLNNTRVIPARLFGRKETGGALEILIERLIDDRHAVAHIRASKAPRPGTRCLLDPLGELLVTGRDDDLFLLESPLETPISAVLEQAGHMPLPPYIERADDALDRERYQTVFADKPGAVAAPTAGLHLDRAMLAAIAAAGVQIETLTLHVGAGTFRPVRGDDVTKHKMHAERIELPPALCRAVNAAQRDGRRVVAVGTTVARALESAALESLPLLPYQGDTRLFIRPGFNFQVVDALLTNFHLPRSTLLMLVCAFAGHAAVMAAYRRAVEENFRFFSYGDAMWLQRATSTPSSQQP